MAPGALHGQNLNSHFWTEAFLICPYMCICYSFPLAFLHPIGQHLVRKSMLGSIGTEIIEKQNTHREILLIMSTGTLLVIPFIFPISEYN